MNDDYRDQHHHQNQYQALPGNFARPQDGNRVQDQQLNFLANSNQDLQGNLEQEQINEEIRLKKKAESFVGEMFFSSIVMLTCVIFTIANNSKPCGQPIRKWLEVYTGIIIADILFTLYQLHWLKKTRKDNIYLMGGRYLNLVLQTSWLIYGNVIYFNEEASQTCQEGGWRLGLFMMVLLGYVDMMKCFCWSLFICILIPIVFFAVRRSRLPQWMPAPPSFIKSLQKTKFNPESNQAFTECAICMVEFQQTDDIIPLPCDEKHYFHQECIKKWLENNNNCPLCKKEITKEALKEQKEKIKEAKKNRK